MEKNQNYLGYEAGPIRPPSECYSLLLRLVRGCAWNKCRFCGFYRGEKFAVRPAAHIKEDIDQLKSWVDVLEGKSSKMPRTQEENEAYHMAMNWYQGGMESVFLQDGNSLLMKPDQLIEVLEHLNRVFPDVERITAYARSDTIARIGLENLKRYAELGLNRFHVGMETGNDELLKLVNKGVDKATQILAGQIAMEAGIEVSEFYMPGLGGLEYAAQSAKDTADVVNQVNPSFIRIRSMAISEKLDLFEDYQNGVFTRSNDVASVRELRSFLEQLEGITSVVESDHMLNVLLELRGQLPEDKAKMLATVDRFLAMGEEEQMLFRLGRRLGIMSAMDDMKNPMAVRRVEQTMRHYGIDKDSIDAVCDQLMKQGIPVQDDRKKD